MFEEESLVKFLMDDPFTSARTRDFTVGPPLLWFGVHSNIHPYWLFPCSICVHDRTAVLLENWLPVKSPGSKVTVLAPTSRAESSHTVDEYIRIVM